MKAFLVIRRDCGDLTLVAANTTQNAINTAFTDWILNCFSTLDPTMQEQIASMAKEGKVKTALEHWARNNDYILEYSEVFVGTQCVTVDEIKEWAKEK